MVADSDAADPGHRLLPADARRPRRSVHLRAAAAARRCWPTSRRATAWTSRCWRSCGTISSGIVAAFRFRPVVHVQGPRRQRHHRAGLSGHADLRLDQPSSSATLVGVAPGRDCGDPAQLAGSTTSPSARPSRAGAAELRDGADPGASSSPGSWAGCPAAAGTAAQWHYIVMPVIALATSYMASIARITRSSMLETLNSNFIRTARAKGLPTRTVIWRHAMKPALMPVRQLPRPGLRGDDHRLGGDRHVFLDRRHRAELRQRRAQPRLRDRCWGSRSSTAR